LHDKASILLNLYGLYLVIFTALYLMRLLRLIWCAALLAMMALPVSGQFYNGSNLTFGKNRVQYRDFMWQHYKFDHYSVYFYEGGKELAEYTAKVTPSQIREVEDMFDFVLQQDIIIVTYRTLSDFRQSNVGLQTLDDNNIGGATVVSGNKVFVYFEGDYEKYLVNIKAGIARIAINQLMYGSNWRETLKSTTLMNMPEWYIDGIVSYASGEWNPEMESIVRDGILTERFRKFNRLTGVEARYAGNYMWRYVAEVYGPSVIPNILYMARMSRNVDNGFLYVLGTSLKNLSQEFVTFYQERYQNEARASEKIMAEALPIKTKKGWQYSQYKLSNDGKHAVYTSNTLGQYRVYHYDIESGKRKKIHKDEHKLDRIIDRSYPVTVWHPSSVAFNFLVEKKGRLLMYTYDTETRKKTKKEIFQLDKVIDLAYAPDGRRMIFSGVKNGQSDLYLYYMLGNRQEQLTNDIYDDLYPRFVNGGSEIIFSSNRPDDTLRSRVGSDFFAVDKDIFVYNLDSRSPLLTRITSTPGVNEIMPAQKDSIRFTFLSRQGDLYQKMTAVRDSAIASIDTTINYRYFSRVEPLTKQGINTIEYNLSSRGNTYSQLVFQNGRYRFLNGDFAEEARAAAALKAAPLKSADDAVAGEQSTIDLQNLPSVSFIRTPVDSVAKEVNIYDYQFSSEFGGIVYEKKVIDVGKTDSAKKKTEGSADQAAVQSVLVLPKARNYKLNFATDYTVTQVNNANFTEFYQPLTGAGNLYPGLSPLLKMGITDLFEDYRIVGGFRISFNLRNTDFMLNFSDYSKRLDKHYFFMRQNNRLFGNFTVLQTQTYHGGFKLGWPLSEVLRIDGTISYRHDRYSLLATDLFALETPSVYEHQGGLKGELVYDNTLAKGLNLRTGTRYKLWGEYYQLITGAQTDFFVVGGDYRFYKSIHRNIIWANRITASTSFGARKLVYYLGGVDNWLFRRTDNSMPTAADQGYQFQALASPMRGFWNNSRNGNSFAVINSEIRFPIFKYLINKPIKSDFLENFQLIGFGDVGSAWTGLHPYSEENEFNRQDITTGGGAVTVVIKNNREPIVYGYGIGLRTRLLGYFVRADWAWGVDDGVRQPAVFYLSLNLDF
jgi:hypothetical protein